MGISAGVINQIIKDGEVDKKLISDGYHTFGELYQHRHALFITLCRTIYRLTPFPKNLAAPDRLRPWRSKKHSDDTMFDDSFIMGIGKAPGEQMSYHLPLRMWDLVDFAQTLDNAPEWDGHSSNDVIERLMELYTK